MSSRSTGGKKSRGMVMHDNSRPENTASFLSVINNEFSIEEGEEEEVCNFLT